MVKAIYYLVISMRTDIIRVSACGKVISNLRLSSSEGGNSQIGGELLQRGRELSEMGRKLSEMGGEFGQVFFGKRGIGISGELEYVCCHDLCTKK